jgi:RNA polymerase sigma factor (sigma-70 family)
MLRPQRATGALTHVMAGAALRSYGAERVRKPLMPMQERSDSELVVQAQAGDHGAYGQLVRRHQRAIVRHLANLTGSRDEAAELAQDVFLKAWEALPEWRPNAPVQPWLFRIASNLAFDLLRRRKTVRFEPIDDAYEGHSSEPQPDRRLQDKQAIAGLQAALQRLPVELSEIILLREVEGLSYQDLSATLRIDEGTVKSRLARARAALIQRYEATHA